MSNLKSGASAKIAAAALCIVLGIGTVSFLGTGSDAVKTSDESQTEVTTVSEQTENETTRPADVTTVVNSISNRSAGAGETGWEVRLEGSAAPAETWEADLDIGVQTGWNVDLIDNPTEQTATSTENSSVQQQKGEQEGEQEGVQEGVQERVEDTPKDEPQQSATTRKTSSSTTTKTSAAKKKTTTTKKSSTSSVPKTIVTKSGYDVNGGTARARLDSVKAEDLKPRITPKGSEKAILEKYMKMLVTDDMTNYEKVLTCYDYLIRHTRYAYGGWSAPMRSVLVKGFGTCTEYSHVLCSMLRYMGFNAHTVWGRTAMARGGYGQHMWVEVKINGNIYVLDAQVDDNLSYGGISHKRFVKLYSEVRGQYIRGHVEKY